MEEKQPFFSIVIPTFGRPTQLQLVFSPLIIFIIPAIVSRLLLLTMAATPLLKLWLMSLVTNLTQSRLHRLTLALLRHGTQVSHWLKASSRPSSTMPGQVIKTIFRG